MSSIPELARLLSSNAQWAADVHKYEPSFFRESAKGQAPKVGLLVMHVHFLYSSLSSNHFYSFGPSQYAVPLAV